MSPIHPIGFWAAAGGDTVSLSGGSGTPNEAGDVQVTPTSAVAGWRFNTDGTLDKYTNPSYSQFGAGTEWVTPTNPTITYYIKATNNVGNNPSSGPSLGSWHALSSVREWKWTRAVPGTDSPSVKIEISDDASGTPILDTGYYGAQLTVNLE